MINKNFRKISLPVFAFVIVLHIMLILFITFPSLSGERQAAREPNSITLFIPDILIPPPPVNDLMTEPLDMARYTPLESIIDETIIEEIIIDETEPNNRSVVQAEENPFIFTEENLPSEITYSIDMLTIRPVFPSGLILENIVYPRSARQQNIEGRVLLEIILEANGEIRSIRIISENPPNLGFAEAAINAFRGVRATPAERNGIQVPARLEFPLLFNLN